MTAPLTPPLALAYLHELSVDVRAAVVLDPAGDPVVGDATLAAPARQLIGRGDAELVSDGALHVARTPDGGAIALLAGDLSLVPLLEHDLLAAARALATARSDLPGR